MADLPVLNSVLFNNALGVTRLWSILAFQSLAISWPDTRAQALSIPFQRTINQAVSIVEQVLRHAVICHQMRPVRLNTSEDKVGRDSCCRLDDAAVKAAWM